MDHASAPLGVFDSGIGGLSVVRALLAELPLESLVYVADSANCPYGTRPPEEVCRLSTGIVHYLLAQGAKIIVVACNTASAAALATLRATFPEVPFVGMVPAVKPAVQITRSGVVGVLATLGTLEGALYHQVVEHHASGVRIVAHACPGLAERVEVGDLDSPGTMALLRACVAPLLAAGADTLVLGCTHYPFLIPALRDLVGEGVHILESSVAVARQTRHVLQERSLVAPQGAARTTLYATTGNLAHFTAALRRLLGGQEDVQSLHWDGQQLQSARESTYC
jgi:glutamate racemase